ncbi:biotin synthase BioB [Bacillus mycoides]|uniref:Radical SAM core domain-containing protein n=1 Tax=Bacillus mycoides TaxID=1405 RepID=A0ABC9QUS1_BACMY|nr:radical SAM protein [Bacillus mycoides]EJR29917.1 hypothetical protein III_05686 [Bacillus mycoides]
MNKHEVIERLTTIGKEQELLFQEARESRFQAYGDISLLRGVIELTNQCRVNCNYCPMRRDNMKNNNIFMLDEKAILNAAQNIKNNNINIVFFQAGEIPATTKFIGEIIPKVKEIFNGDVEILLNLGVKKREEYKYLRDQGATSFILKHETSDPILHEALRHEPLKVRIQAITDLLELGYFVGAGSIIGLPNQSIESIAEDILLAKRLGVHMSSVSTFIPAPNTPLENLPNGSINTTLNAIATMRLLSPQWLIPSVSALEKTMKGGQVLGYHAGANVMTINFTPDSQSDKYLIYGEDRFVVKLNHAQETLKSAGLKATTSIFNQLLKNQFLI